MKNQLHAEPAEELLRDWPSRLAMIPTVKPLNDAWLPTVSPTTGKNSAPNGQKRPANPQPCWWRWSADDPVHLMDATCDAILPDEFPYRNLAAMQAYTTTMNQHDDLTLLAQAYEQTGDTRFAQAVVDLLAEFAPIYCTFPLTLQEEANPHELLTHGPEICGVRYAVRVNPAWGDTKSLQGWLRAYSKVCRCDDIEPCKHDAVRTLAVAVLETNALPNFLYFNDKYHNSLTNYYEVFVLAASIWGQAIEVCDVVSAETYRGGDLAQLAINGPAGLRMFVANAFDREGTYWELSSSYTNYVLHYLDHLIPVLEGYSDPPQYQPHPAVAPFYELFKTFCVSESLSTLWRAVRAPLRTALNGGQLLPTNDANYLNRVDPPSLHRWAELLDAPQLKRAAQQAEAFKDGQPDSGLLTSSTLMAASGGATLRGPANRLNVHLDWHRVQDYHSHLDPLNLVMSTEGCTTLSDLGYHLYHPLRHILSERTAAHNTVTVDQQDARPHGRGHLHHVALDAPLQFLDASVDDAYAVCDQYRRAVVIVGDRYMVDVFRVQGGHEHDYTLLSRADRTQTTLPINRSTDGTLAHPDVAYSGFDHLDASAMTPASPYEVMHHPQFAQADGPFHVDWLQRDRPDLSTRVHHLPQDKSSQVVFACVPYKERLQQNQVRTDQAMLVRRSGAPDLHSVFVSVIETLSQTVPPLVDVQRLEVQSADPAAAAVRVRHDSGSDVIVVACTPGPHDVASEGLRLEGHFAGVCYSADSNTAQVTLLGRELHTPLGTVRGTAAHSARVLALDVASGRLELDRPVPEGKTLVGQFIAVRGAAGTDSHWRVAEVGADGRTITVDLDHSQLITLQGMIQRVESPRLFTSGLRLPEPPPLHTPIRIGTIGDFLSPRYSIRYAQQTGLPLRIGGLTTAESLREYHIGLDPSAQLSQADVGKWFWTSGIEIGDVVCIETASLHNLSQHH